MSSGANSGLAHGPQGSPQLTLENYKYAMRVAELQDAAKSVSLTASQKNTVNTVVNNIKDHLTEKDYLGVERDLNGNPIPKGDGGYWDHIAEMKDSYRSLERSKRSLEGSLQNPNLNHAQKEVLQIALREVCYHIGRIDALFKPYGGIKQWKRK